MSSNLIAYLIAALTLIIGVLVVFGFPALAIVLARYFKLKESELKYFKLKEGDLALEMEHRQKSQQQQRAIEQRVQRLEDVLNSLDHDVRVRLGIEPGAPPPPSHPDLLEGPAAPDAQRGQSPDTARTKAR